jgi:aminopeptidase N
MPASRRPISLLALPVLLLLLAPLSLHAQRIAAGHDHHSATCTHDPELRALQDAEIRRHVQRMRADDHTIQSAKNYDVDFYRLAVRMLKNETSFSGSVRVQLTSLVANLSRVDLNAAANLVIDSVFTGDGTRCTYTHTAGVLSITPLAPIPQSTRAAFVIHYRSPYNGSAIDVTPVQHPELGRTTISIASQAEPYDARAWWPCKDDPSDKADSVEVIVTTDLDMYPVSNGLVTFEQTHPDNTHTVAWKSHYPIVTYLVSVAIGTYNVRDYTFTYGNWSMPVTNWFYGLRIAEMEQHATTMLDGLKVLSDLYGIYPFIEEKYGMAEYEWGGAMEHQTVSSMGFYGQDVVIHELAHQWFGDKVTCATFEHIWLNEGWATYSEALYREAKGGLPALKAKMATTAFYGGGKIFVDNPESKPMSVIFSGSLTYNKSSWVVHMLRGVVGDTAFFRAARAYLGALGDRASYRPVTTDEFRGFFEAESGMDLAPFFNQWIHGEYFPTYVFEWNAKDSLGRTAVTVDITQAMVPQRQIFDMPIRLRFTLPTGDTTIIVRNSTELATYSFLFDARPTAVALDPDNWILKQVQQPVKNPTFDKGILLVNGVDWDVEAYTDEIKSAYENLIFTGTHSYTFWDAFPNPAAGYPSTITSVAGSGAVSADEIKKYCTVVWIGNAYNGDEAAYLDTPIDAYIRAGGNVILITRLGRTFLTSENLQQLGVSWMLSPQATIRNCVADQSWLSNMTFTGEQSLIAPVTPTLLRPENELLFSDTQAFTQRLGIGVWGKPVPQGEKQSGHLVYMAMRPYRVDHTDMRATMQALLDRVPCVPVTSVDVPGAVTTAALAQNYPNPFSARTASGTVIPFTVGGAGAQHVVLRVHDALGRQVRTVVDGMRTAGGHEVVFDARGLPPGVYSYSLTIGGVQSARTMLVLQ